MEWQDQYQLRSEILARQKRYGWVSAREKVFVNGCMSIHSTLTALLVGNSLYSTFYCCWYRTPGAFRGASFTAWKAAIGFHTLCRYVLLKCMSAFCNFFLLSECTIGWHWWELCWCDDDLPICLLWSFNLNKLKAITNWKDLYRLSWEGLCRSSSWI